MTDTPIAMDGLLRATLLSIAKSLRKRHASRRGSYLISDADLDKRIRELIPGADSRMRRRG